MVIQKAFQDGNCNGHSGKSIQMTFKMAIGNQKQRGDYGRQDSNGNGNQMNSSEFQDSNGNGNLGEIFSSNRTAGNNFDSNGTVQIQSQARLTQGLHWEFHMGAFGEKRGFRNSGAWNGCANFMGAWKSAFFLQENLHAHKIPCFSGGYLGSFVLILFLWARGFFWVVG